MTISLRLSPLKGSLMARQLSIEYEGAIYHVVNRGARREEIFRDDVNRNSFLHTLGRDFGKD